MYIKTEPTISYNTLLKNLSHCDNIQLDEALEDDLYMKYLKSKAIERILEKNHPYNIYFSDKENAWRTYLYDKTKKNHRYAVKRRSEEELKLFLANYYIEQDELRKKNNITLESAYEKWLIFRRDYTSVTSKTIKENMYDWNRFFKSTELASTKLRDITPIMLIRFFRMLTKNRSLTYKRVSNARGILNGIFSWAIEEEILSHNPISDVNFKSFSYRPVEEQTDNVYSKHDAKILLKYLQGINDDPYALAIQLAFNLFIRIGELKAIRWKDIDYENRTVYIHNQALLDNVINDDLSIESRTTIISDYIKGYTSKGYRKEYLTDQALTILGKAKALNPSGEFIFEPFGKLMITDTFNERLKKYCNECGVTYHSSHKIRFYCASTAYNGNNLTTISRLMGHSQVSTTIHYLRNVNKGTDDVEAFENLGLREENY